MHVSSFDAFRPAASNDCERRSKRWCNQNVEHEQHGVARRALYVQERAALSGCGRRVLRVCEGLMFWLVVVYLPFAPPTESNPLPAQRGASARARSRHKCSAAHEPRPQRRPWHAHRTRTRASTLSLERTKSLPPLERTKSLPPHTPAGGLRMAGMCSRRRRWWTTCKPSRCLRSCSSSSHISRSPGPPPRTSLAATRASGRSTI